jgi:hypothetical protein
MKRRQRIWAAATLMAMSWDGGIGAQWATADAPSIPVTILVRNRETKQTHVYPASAAEAHEADPVTTSFRASYPSYPRFVGIAAIPKALATPEQINGLSEPLASRAAIYAQTLLRELKGIRLVAADPWSVEVLKVVGRAGLLSRDLGSSKAVAQSWPLSVPLLTTTLARPERVLGPSDEPRTAALFVIECRADSAAGVVEQIDLMAFRDGRMARTYWTRETLDPTYFVKTDKALAQVAERFRQRLGTLMRDERVAQTEPAVEVHVHRLLDDRTRRLLFQVAQQLEGGVKTEPRPVRVDRDHIIYRVVGTGTQAALKGSMEEKLKTAAGLALSPEAGASKLQPVFEVASHGDGALRLDPAGKSHERP